MTQITTSFPDKVLIGSSAVEHWAPGLLQREAKDRDYLALEPDEDSDFINGVGVVDSYSFSGPIASLDEVYSLKVSHSPWVKNETDWMKHLKDIRRLQDAGASLIPELHKLAYKQWELRKGKKNVNLNQDREEFFNGNVRRKYVHDSIHASMAFGENPLYMKILAEGEEVQTSKELFFRLSQEDKENLVREEVMVLSLERDLIPRESETVDRVVLYSSYSKRLRLLMTQYAKGYFPQWIIENYFRVNRPTLDYWEKFQKSDKKVLL